MNLHTFAICAYKDSPYLEACIRSLKAQTVPSDIILCTSTPSSYIEHLADWYEIPLFVREGESDIQEDWNFAYDQAKTEWVTIAHQDDMYRKEYTRYLLKAYETYQDLSVFMGNCIIVKNNQPQKPDKVALVKKLLRLPLRNPKRNHRTRIKRRALLLGNPVICPSCAYHKTMLPKKLFDSQFKFALDWDTMLKLAEMPGRFYCEERPVMYYRIHDGATTKECIVDHRRAKEEEEMFAKIWPKPVVRLLMRYYKKAYDSYDETKI